MEHTQTQLFATDKPGRHKVDMLEGEDRDGFVARIAALSEANLLFLEDDDGRWVQKLDGPIRCQRAKRYGTAAFETILDAELAPDWDEEAEDKDELPRSVVPNRYKKAYRARGDESHCGDDLASWLKDVAFEDLERAAVEAGLVEYGQYKHLNPGMQRMNVGNRVRKLIRTTPKGTIAIVIYGRDFYGEAPAAADAE